MPRAVPERRAGGILRDRRVAARMSRNRAAVRFNPRPKAPRQMKMSERLQEAIDRLQAIDERQAALTASFCNEMSQKLGSIADDIDQEAEEGLKRLHPQSSVIAQLEAEGWVCIPPKA